MVTESGRLICPTPDCEGDARYAAPGRGHREGCAYPHSIGDLIRLSNWYDNHDAVTGEPMSRFRVTIRGEGTELRGYATAEALAALADDDSDPFIVVASLAEDDYDPFRSEGRT